MAETLLADVAVVGAGPAGVAAACRAAESGARVVLVDEGLAPGGQIHRHLPGEEPPAEARPWLARLWKSGTRVVTAGSVFDAERRGDGWRLRAMKGEQVLLVRAGRMVLATGARELFLPFPGWTLPGVIGAGAAQALVKSGAEFRGRTAVVAGTGPLLLAAAAGLAGAGARIAAVAEQAPVASLARFAVSLLPSPAKLLEGARCRLAFAGASYRTGTWVRAAEGDGGVTRARLTDGAREHVVRCDLLCTGFGLVPNLELPRLIGCAVAGPGVEVNGRQETSVPGVFAAGEICGIAGAEGALAEGEIAGLAAADALGAADPAARKLVGARERARRFGGRMARAFRLRPEVLRLAAPDTIVCRCEDVPLSRLVEPRTTREAKLHARAGMGPCQGRVCFAALEALRGLAPDTVRPPLVPVPVEALAAEEEESP